MSFKEKQIVLSTKEQFQLSSCQQVALIDQMIPAIIMVHSQNLYRDYNFSYRIMS